MPGDYSGWRTRLPVLPPQWHRRSPSYPPRRLSNSRRRALPSAGASHAKSRSATPPWLALSRHRRFQLMRRTRALSSEVIVRCSQAADAAKELASSCWLWAGSALPSRWKDLAFSSRKARVRARWQQPVVSDPNALHFLGCSCDRRCRNLRSSPPHRGARSSGRSPALGRQVREPSAPRRLKRTSPATAITFTRL